MTPITLRQLVKRFGQTVAVDGVDLDIHAGELFFLLGPSGCGKTTLLRMLAGFTEPTGGTIHFGDKNVTHQPSNKRNTGMVFQGYALWPHMTVAQNVAFGLDVRKISSTEKNERIHKALGMVQMTAYAERKPNELSGGQQQRVALARALVIEPTVLLLDEPLSNLDAKLRLEMRLQIRDICKQTNITAVYVTHDQKEALSMADRLAVMREGKIIQVGEPRQVYDRPNSRFVADFLGETNFISATIIEKTDSRITLHSQAGILRAAVFPANLPEKGNVTCSIRPEAMRILREGERMENEFSATADDPTYLGETAQYRFHLGDGVEIKLMELHPQPRDSHIPMRIGFAAEDTVILNN